MVNSYILTETEIKNTQSSLYRPETKDGDPRMWVERLAEKHHETFWIDVESRINSGIEEFRVMTIDHTKNPLLPQFDVLLEQGKIKLDLMLSRPSGRGDTYSFKMDKKHRTLLFPENETYIINHGIIE